MIRTNRRQRMSFKNIMDRGNNSITNMENSGTISVTEAMYKQNKIRLILETQEEARKFRE